MSLKRRRRLPACMARPIFVAAPEAGAGNLALLDKLTVQLQVATGGAVAGSSMFVPHLQAGDPGVETTREAYFTRSLEALQDARVVVAVLDGPQVDENVAFLLGYAFAAGKPVVGFVSDGREKGPFAEGALAATVHDVKGLAAALQQILAR